VSNQPARAKRSKGARSFRSLVLSRRGPVVPDSKSPLPMLSSKCPRSTTRSSTGEASLTIYRALPHRVWSTSISALICYRLPVDPASILANRRITVSIARNARFSAFLAIRFYTRRQDLCTATDGIDRLCLRYSRALGCCDVAQYNNNESLNGVIFSSSSVSFGDKL